MKLGAIIMSGLIHGVVLYAMTYLPEEIAKRAPSVVKMALVKPKPKPPPPPPPPKPKKKKPKPPPPPAVKPKLVKKIVKKVEMDEPPPAPEPEKPKPPPKGFSIDMSSTVKGGAGPVAPAIKGGGNMFADPNDRREPGKKVKKRTAPAGHGKKGKPNSYRITSQARFLGSASERTPPYPKKAKRLGIEGTVDLLIFVGKNGRVEKVKLLRGLGYGCDEIAVKWAKERWRFEPAMAGTEPVGVWVKVPVHFVIEI